MSDVIREAAEYAVEVLEYVSKKSGLTHSDAESCAAQLKAALQSQTAASPAADCGEEDVEALVRQVIEDQRRHANYAGEPELVDGAIAYVFPDDLQRLKMEEGGVIVYSVPRRAPDRGKPVPLFEATHP